MSTEQGKTTMAQQKPLSLIAIVAITRTNGLGVNGQLPWRLSREMAHFRKATSALGENENTKMNAVIMGRKTWQSIPPKFRPLKGRVNVVISRQNGKEAEKSLGISPEQHSHLVSSLDAAADLLASASTPSIYRTFLIGGAQLYKEAMEREQSQSWSLDKLMITRIHSPAFEECDVFLPEFRTIDQIKQDEQFAGIGDDQSAIGKLKPLPEQKWSIASNQEFDQFMGEPVAHGIEEEKDVRYTFQLWDRKDCELFSS